MEIVIDIRKAAARAGVVRANQLGMRAGLSPSVASRWWKGRGIERMEISVLERICDALDCNIKDIIKTRE